MNSAVSREGVLKELSRHAETLRGYLEAATADGVLRGQQWAVVTEDMGWHVESRDGGYGLSPVPGLALWSAEDARALAIHWNTGVESVRLKVKVARDDYVYRARIAQVERSMAFIGKGLALSFGT